MPEAPEMTEHTVEVTNSKGRTMRVLIRLTDRGQGTWQTLDKGYFRYEGGVADTGHYPTYPLAWVALYGGDRVDDEKLVFHLDDYLGFTGVNPRGGEGWVYPRDDLLMERGEVSWRLIS